MTPLAALIAARIGALGPVTLADYMADCLLHPDHGYYTTRTPFGAAGDFTTAPEISQMYGELLGLALAQGWLDQGAPAPFQLAEFGPGRGTLMADVLRATRGVPGFHAAMRIVLMEASPALRARQKAALAGHAPIWIDGPADLPDLPLFLLANEFFDALPIHQFRRGETGWHEVMVALQDGRLRPVLTTDAIPPGRFDPRFSADPVGQVVELCTAAAAPVQAIADRLRRFGGLAVIADYGGWRSAGDTLQALRAHAFTDPFAEPGLADLTAHVDFEALTLAAGPGLAHAFAPQGRVLTSLGIEARTAALAARLGGAALDTHLAAARRLTDAGEMGVLFKMLALYPEGAPPPFGFADA